MKEKEEQQEDEADNEEQQKEGETGETGEVIIEQTESKKSREPRPRNPCRSKKKEVAQEEAEEEEEEYEKTEEANRKRKVIGCINPQEAMEFQNFIKGKMEELVDKMKAEKDIINPVRRFIRELKVQYDKIHLFENNGAANTKEIVDTIPDTKGIAWRKNRSERRSLTWMSTT